MTNEINRRKMDMEERAKSKLVVGKKGIKLIKIKIVKKKKGQPLPNIQCETCEYELEDSNKGQCKYCSWQSHWTAKKPKEETKDGILPKGS